jgi:hypothetical protein
MDIACMVYIRNVGRELGDHVGAPLPLPLPLPMETCWRPASGSVLLGEVIRRKRKPESELAKYRSATSRGRWCGDRNLERGVREPLADSMSQHGGHSMIHL